MAGIVVTGAAGHLGGSLVRELHARGQQVRALVHRDRRALEGLDVEVTVGDVLDERSLRHAFSGADVVYHTAAYISITMGERQRLHKINVEGTRNVVEACLHCGVNRLVHVSSIEVLECEPLCEPVDESRPLVQSQSALPYAGSKAAGERQVRQGMARGLDAVILYPTAMIGPYDYRQGFPNAGLRAICEGRLWALVEGGFDWVDVRDVAQGALRAAERAPAGARYILSGHWASLHDLAVLAREITGTPVPRLMCPMGLARISAPFVTAACRLLGKRPLYTSAALVPLAGNQDISHARATRELGYQPRPLRRTVVDTMQWFTSMGISTGQLPLSAAGGQLVDSPGGE
jgi:dihydroflavonol-4-reductase